MTNDHPRMNRERRTVEAMLDIYCHAQHDVGRGLCEECENLRDYAWQRLQTCPFQAGKTTCAKCLMHCYKPEMRARVRAVMRYAGPRMLYRHPIMTLQHLLDGVRDEPVHPRTVRVARGNARKGAKS